MTVARPSFSSVSKMSSLLIEQKVGQLFFIGIPGKDIDAATARLLDRVLPGGVCLFSRNIRERSQTRELLDSLREVLPLEPMLSVDQEGGLVDRLRRIITPMPAADRIRTTEQAADFGRIVGETLRSLGFNMNFAPVVDIVDAKRGTASNGLHSRAFGKDRDESVELAGQFLRSMQDEGCVGCLKHFPGLGASEVDSHKELPLVPITDKEMFATDLVPYKRLIESGDAKLVMVAHAAFPKVRLQEQDQNGKLLPSSLSPAIISTLLRGDLGFSGLVLTDDLEMGAIVENFGIGEACKLAVAAGVDMLAICASSDAIERGFEAVGEAVISGAIDESRIDESLERIDLVRKSLQKPLSFDDRRLDELSDEIAGLIERLN